MAVTPHIFPLISALDDTGSLIEPGAQSHADDLAALPADR